MRFEEDAEYKVLVKGSLLAFRSESEVPCRYLPAMGWLHQQGPEVSEKRLQYSVLLQ